MTAKDTIKHFKTVFRCMDKYNKVCYVTVDCYGPDIPSNSSDNEQMLIDICQVEFDRLNVTPLKVEGLDYE